MHYSNQPYVTKITRRILTLLLMTAFTMTIQCSRANVEKGVACLKLGDYAMAEQFFSSVLLKNPNHYAARVGMGKALLQRAIDNRNDTTSWRVAFMHLEAARTLQPSSGLNNLLAQVWSERARMLLEAIDTLSALQALTKAIEYDPRWPEPLNSAGIIYFRLGELEKSKALFQKAASIDSTNSAVQFNLGMIAWHEGDIKAAHAFWLFGLRHTPSDPEMLYWFARAEKELRDHPAPETEQGHSLIAKNGSR